MTVIAAKVVKSPTDLEWWEWGKLLGAILALALPLLGICGVRVPHLVVGLALHVILDFTLQSAWVATNKSRGGTALLIHAVTAGGIACGAGLSLVGIVVGMVTHYLIDHTNKFGRTDVIGIVADQCAHVIVITVVCVLL